MPRYLIIAHQTATSEELEQAVVGIANREDDAEFWLVVPATPVEHLLTWTEGESQAVAAAQADLARKSLEAAGVTLRDVAVGDASPVDAARDALREREFDAVVISTLPLNASRWLRMDAVHRLERELAIPVIHVEVEEEEDDGDG
jgi:hypothetical protein